MSHEVSASDKLPERMGARTPYVVIDLLVLLLLVLAVSASNIWWLNRDRLDVGHDEALHMITSLQCYHLLSHRCTPILEGIYGVTHAFPPVVYVSSYPFYAWFHDFGRRTATLTHLLYLPLLFAAVYGLGKELWGREVGLMSAVLTASAPLLIGLSRAYFLDLPLTAIVAASLYALWRSRLFSERNWSIVFGFTFMVGMLIKTHFLVYIIGATAYGVFDTLRARSERKRRLLNGSWAVLMTAPAVSWTLSHMADILNAYRVATHDSMTRKTAQSYTYVAAHPHWLLAFPFDLFSSDILLPPFLLFLAGLYYMVFSKTSGREKAFVLTSMSVPVLFFSYHPDRLSRFYAPILPLVAVTASYGLYQVPKMLSQFAKPGIIVWSVAQFYVMTFASRPINLGWASQGFECYIIRSQGRFYRLPSEAQWHNADLAATLERHTASHRLYDVVVLPNLYSFGQGSMMLAVWQRNGVDLHNIRIRIERPESLPGGTSDLAGYDFIVRKTGQQLSQLADAWTSYITDNNSKFEWLFEPIGSWPLPDGSIATVYQRTRVSSAKVDVPVHHRRRERKRFERD